MGKKTISCIFIFYVYIVSGYSEVRLGLNIGDTLYLQKNVESQKCFSSNFLSISPKIEFTIYKGFEGFLEIEYSHILNELYTIDNTVFILGIQGNFSLPQNYFIRPKIEWGIFGMTALSNILFSNTAQIPGGGAFIGVDIAFIKRLLLKRNAIELCCDIQWRKEVRYSPFSLSLGINYVLCN